jgi:hypothetical protein
VGKEGVFFGCLSILIVFEVGYYLLNPTSTWSLGIGAISSIVIVGITTGLLAGLNVAATGENGFGSRLGFISATLFCILFQFDIPIASTDFDPLSASALWTLHIPGITPPIAHTTGLPVGIGLLYPNMSNIFITGLNDPISMFGLIIMSIIVFITVISGLMIAAGEHG